MKPLESPQYCPKWLQRMGRAQRRRWDLMMTVSSGPVAEVLSDNLPHLVPIVTVTNNYPKTLRKNMGRATWRTLHHASTTANLRRALIYLEACQVWTWSDIVSIQLRNLQKVAEYVNSTVRASDALLYTGRKAEKGEFEFVLMLRRDTPRMGVEVNDNWSINRLVREHDAASERIALKEASPEPWAQPFVHEVDGYRFERLISDLDLAREAREQRNCVASYKVRARMGQIVVFRVTGAERATFAFTPLAQELRGYRNSDVSADCAAAASTLHAALLMAGIRVHPMMRSPAW